MNISFKKKYVLKVRAWIHEDSQIFIFLLCLKEGFIKTGQAKHVYTLHGLHSIKNVYVYLSSSVL